MSGRKTDNDQRLWFRSSRVFASNGSWYFHTREGVDMGPYETQFEAEIEAGILLKLLRESDPTDQSGSARVIREFVLDSFDMGRPLAPSLNSNG